MEMMDSDAQNREDSSGPEHQGVDIQQIQDMLNYLQSMGIDEGVL